MEDQIIIHINREQNVLLQRLARKYCCTVDDLIEEAVYEYCADDRKTEPQTNADQHVQHVGSVEQTEREGE